jgi:hypothetical protein
MASSMPLLLYQQFNRIRSNLTVVDPLFMVPQITLKVRTWKGTKMALKIADV